MSHEPLLECAFFIPIRRDANLADGDLHSEKALAWLRRELYLQFEGATIAPGFYKGFYKDPDTGRQVTDRSRKYIVAAPLAKVGALRVLLAKACNIFKQKCIYLSVGGEVVSYNRILCTAEVEEGDVLGEKGVLPTNFFPRSTPPCRKLTDRMFACQSRPGMF